MPRRSLAQEFCDSGLIRVNGAQAKSSKEIKPRDVLEIRRRQRYLKVVVREVPATKQIPKHSAAALYEVVEERETAEDEN